MTIIIKIFKAILSFIYMLIKLLPTRKNRVIFLSRQDSQLSLDFRLLKEELEKEDVDIKYICSRLGDGDKNYLKFGLAMLKSMVYLATARVCVIDAYWPAVSMLKHKKDLCVIQMWHALGKIKKSGYQTLDKEFGRSKKMSELLNMHEGYTYIVAGGKAWNPMYMASFNTTEDKLVNIGLPRIDHLLSTRDSNREKVLSIYPEFKDKKVILYAPTFRRNDSNAWEKLLEEIDFEQYYLIVKAHPNQKLTWDNENVYSCPEFKAVDLLSTADYLITDYSAIAIEGAILNTKTYYYLYDYQEYRDKNGMNIDIFTEMPGCAFREASELMAALKGEYSQKALDRYREKFLPEELGTSTKKLAQLVMKELG
ncbi:MAG: CDP-glycerol glycerophosphotransferase family protein [Clostridia bacterium]|nr:CDP-glycerol glycerophosphotransferase family protein [Clostridia bacterium]